MRIILIFVFGASAMPALGQDGVMPVNVINTVYAAPFSFNTRHGAPQDALNSVRGNPFANSGSFFAMLSNKFNFNVPTRLHYTISNGINFQAGLLLNSRQPKLGATVSMPRGLNISAGYGANMPGLGRQGFSSMGRNPGVQISASYRIFRRK